MHSCKERVVANTWFWPFFVTDLDRRMPLYNGRQRPSQWFCPARVRDSLPRSNLEKQIGWKTWWPLKIGLNAPKGKANVFQLHPFFRCKNDVSFRETIICMPGTSGRPLFIGFNPSKQGLFSVKTMVISSSRYIHLFFNLSKRRQMIETKTNRQLPSTTCRCLFSIHFGVAVCWASFRGLWTRILWNEKVYGSNLTSIFLFSRKEPFQIDVVTNGTPWFFS